MADIVIDGSLYVTGAVTIGGAVSLPEGSIGNLQASSVTPMQPEKTVSQRVARYSSESATSAASGAHTIHTARAAGTLKTFRAGTVVANIGAATITVDLKKNGTTVLTAVITLDNSHVAYQQVSGALSSTAFVAGDVFEVVIVATAGGGTLGKGLFAQLNYNESNL